MSAEVIWSRTSGASRKWQPAAIAAIVALVGFGVFASWKAGDPESMRFLGATGGFLVFLVLLAPWLLGAARRVDKELTFDGSSLRCGNQKDVPTHDVTGWRVSSGTNVVHSGAGAASPSPFLRLELIHRDGRSSSFGWSHPHADDEATLRAAMTARFGPEISREQAG